MGFLRFAYKCSLFGYTYRSPVISERENYAIIDHNIVTGQSLTFCIEKPGLF